jgi:methionine-rich copper-binding protein CopC
MRVVAALLVLAAPTAAHAHSTLVRATPAARATLKMPPERVQLWFSERLEPAYSSASVWREDQRIDRQDSAVSPQDPKLLTVSVPALTPGKYVVRYRVLSVDGHVVEGRLPFTVAGEAAGSGATGK